MTVESAPSKQLPIGARSPVFIGPVFTREAAIAPRRPRLYVLRTIYAVALLVLMCTAWLVLAGTQTIRNIGDMARFGASLFQILAPLQMALILFLAAIQSASTVALEKDRKTLILLLMTRMTNSELVLGKLMSSLLTIAVLLATALPIFMLIVLFGGVSFHQVFWVFAVTFMSALVAGSLGSTLAFWREKTFQTLALTSLAIVFWIGVWEAVGLTQGSFLGLTADQWSGACSPVRAILAATNPSIDVQGPVSLPIYLGVMTVLAVVLNGLAIARVRIWNPGREVRPGQAEAADQENIWGETEDDPASREDETARSEQARSEHVDARVRPVSQKSRQVWDNPILWREVCTWAHGKKVIAIRVAYWILFLLAGLALHATVGSADTSSAFAGIVPPVAQSMAPFLLVSLVIVNALAVTTLTNERDGRALDLLLVTDLSPREFLFGKLGGVAWVAREMIVLPIVLAIYLWVRGGISVENLVYLVLVLGVLNVFVSMLGVHCGMTYANSRQAIGVSLGTVFFLFLGIVTCMMMMISFSETFQGQLTSFLAFIVGGGVGLYVAWGHRNPSPAIALASGVLPLAMFFAITSLLLERPLSVFLVLAATYGFATTAMMMPALGEFNIAMGRSLKTSQDE